MRHFYLNEAEKMPFMMHKSSLKTNETVLADFTEYCFCCTVMSDEGLCVFISGNLTTTCLSPLRFASKLIAAVLDFKAKLKK